MAETTRQPGKWTVSTNEELWIHYEEFDTEAEAIAAGPELLGLEDGQRFYVGQTRKPSICVPDADDIIEHVCCQDDFDGDYADPIGGTKEQLQELTDAVDKLFRDWMQRHGLEPMFFIIENMTEHIAPEHLTPTPGNG